MPSSPALREARKAWRNRQHAKGIAWACILANHAVCTGYVGRLRSNTELVRPPCACPCHQDAEP